jgi:sugar transferase (PEP-CTERM system associated)
MLKISNHYVSKVAASLLLIEIMMLMAAFHAGAAILLLPAGAGAPPLHNLMASALAFALAIVFSMSTFGMYHQDLAQGFRPRLFLQLLPAFAMAVGILAVVFYVAPSLYVGRGVLLLVLGIALAGVVLVRAMFVSGSQSKMLTSRLIFLGHGAVAKECGELAANTGSYQKYQVAGYVATPNEACCVNTGALLHMDLGDSLVDLARRYKAREIVVTVQERRGGALPIKDLLECKLHGVKVIDATTFFERESGQIRVDSLQPSWLVFGGGFDQSPVRIVMKRVFDLVVSAVILALALPVMLLTAAAIRFEDGGPVFYQQERVGKDGRHFFILKFRSMGIDAEQAGSPQWAMVRDPRVTRIGNIIRKCRIDELPQLLNVFKGEMSFVGPRPERPYFVDQLNAQLRFYQLRHSIKPGITGWAQVRYGYGASVSDAIQKLQYDLYYVKNNSLFLDVLVLIDTLKVVLFGSGR